MSGGAEGMQVIENRPEVNNENLRRTMQELVELSTTPATWTGLTPEGIAQSLINVLFDTLSIELLYVRFGSSPKEDLVEAVRTRHGSQSAQMEAVKASLHSILSREVAGMPATIVDPFGEGTLHLAINRFDIAGEGGMLIAGSLDVAFPTERDRLLLGVGANQTAIVLQRWKAEEQVREQGELLRTTLASIGDAVITTDTEGRCTNLNTVAESLTGWQTAEAIGQPLHVVFHIVNEQTRQVVANPAIRALQEGIIVGLANHTILIAKDGKENPIEDSAAPIRSKTGQIVGCVLVFRDVAERRRLERENVRREENSRFLAAIITSSNDAIISKSLDGMIQSWNAAAERIFGYTAEQAIGRHISLLIPTERLEEEDRIIAKLRAGQRVEHFDTVRIRSDGQRVFVSLTISPIKNAVGEIIGASKIARDITERKENEERLKNTEEQIIQLGNAIAQLAWMARPDGHIDWYNDRWYQYTGKTFAQMEGWGWQSVHDPAALPEVNKRWQRALTTGETFDMTFPLRGADGLFRPFLTRIVPFRNADGKIVRWFGTNTDISEQQHIQEELRIVAARLSEADRRKDDFLATLAHELRNPLAPIRTGLELMKSLQDEPATLEEIRSTMERQTQQLIALVDDLLDVSRITKGKLELRRCRVQLADVVQSAVEASHPFISEANHELAVSIPQQPIYLNADPNRLAQVLSNLLNNSTKYTPEGGRIRLSAEQQGSQVVVSVADNGLGIPADMLDRIFEMFAQVDRPQEKGYTGLGIGLSLVKSLVEMHDGSIQVRSEGADKGSVFSVRLPIAVKTSVDEQSPEQLEAPAKTSIKRKVLIVDDNKAAATMLKMVVKMMGNEVRTADNGLEAIEVAADFLPEVVLMDLGMPKMNGYEAARYIREQPWGKEMLLVALTGWGQEDDRQRTVDAGFNHHLVKPAEPADIQKLLAEFNSNCDH